MPSSFVQQRARAMEHPRPISGPNPRIARPARGCTCTHPSSSSNPHTATPAPSMQVHLSARRPHSAPGTSPHPAVGALGQPPGHVCNPGRLPPCLQRGCWVVEPHTVLRHGQILFYTSGTSEYLPSSRCFRCLRAARASSQVLHRTRSWNVPTCCSQEVRGYMHRVHTVQC